MDVPQGDWDKKEVPEVTLKGINNLAIEFFSYDDELAELDRQKKEITKKQADVGEKISAQLEESGLTQFRCSKGLLYYRTFNTCKITDWAVFRNAVGEKVWGSLAKPSAASVSKWFNTEKEKKEEEGIYEYQLDGVIHNEFTKLVKKKK